MLDKSVYINRRQELLRRLSGEHGVALFVGNVDAAAQYRDNCYKWRQDSTWLYLFGIDEPRLAATVDLETGETVLYGDDCDIDDIIWNGPTPSVSDYAAQSGIERTAPYKDIHKALAGRRIHFVPASRHYNAQMIADLVGISPRQCFSEGKKGCPSASRPLVEALVQMRLVKDNEEIRLIDQACALGQQMHAIARNAIEIGVIEQEIVGKMEGFCLSKGWGVSFATILTQHGEIFHCHSHDQRIEPGKLMVIDAGLESNEHYASDFTRTYPTGGVYTQKQKEVYSIVCDCNNLAFSMIKPGVKYVDVHNAVAEFMLSRLGELGLVSGNPAEMAAKGYAGLFMPHGLGHNMGLDVHDMEDYGEDFVGYDEDQTRSSLLGLGSLRMARRLKPGNVITDEPGIYFIPALIEKWKSEGIGRGEINYDKLLEYYDFGGIRLEDDVLVTEDGARRLGAERLPIDSQDVENAMKH